MRAWIWNWAYKSRNIWVLTNFQYGHSPFNNWIWSKFNTWNAVILQATHLAWLLKDKNLNDIIASILHLTNGWDWCAVLKFLFSPSQYTLWPQLWTSQVHLHSCHIAIPKWGSCIGSMLVAWPNIDSGEARYKKHCELVEGMHKQWSINRISFSNY